ncbi:erythromycin esterase family protein [Kitasatospora sp. NPDC053057]|uniref:erythromycin esterase family protein n=1 Tax=Kitasatospora sp. NPDC053057 TaxID=3364062 RepID=UPI0037C9EEC3
MEGTLESEAHFKSRRPSTVHRHVHPYLPEQDHGYAGHPLWLCSRDQVMAETTVWWQRRTGGRILLSAADDHVGYTAPTPTTYPKTQGVFLHDALGADYLAIGRAYNVLVRLHTVREASKV